jgi:glycerol-3-phosphate acyltransferase PlsY
MPDRPGSWGAPRTLLWTAAAFAAGGIPFGRLVTRALTGRPLSELGDGKPGTSNVRRSLGLKPAILVLALDAGKAYVPAQAARMAGAGDPLVAAIGISAMLGHISFVQGRGAACALGTAYAMDPLMMTIAWLPLAGGGLIHRHAESVAVTSALLPLISLALHRDRPSRALGPLAMILVLFAARLRGSADAPFPASPGVLARRLWLDRDED